MGYHVIKYLIEPMRVGAAVVSGSPLFALLGILIITTYAEESKSVWTVTQF